MRDEHDLVDVPGGQGVDLVLRDGGQIGQHLDPAGRGDRRQRRGGQPDHADSLTSLPHDGGFDQATAGQARLARIVEVGRREGHPSHRLDEPGEGRRPEVELVVADGQSVVAEPGDGQAVVERSPVLLRGLEGRAGQVVVAGVEQVGTAAPGLTAVVGSLAGVMAQLIDLGLESGDSSAPASHAASRTSSPEPEPNRSSRNSSSPTRAGPGRAKRRQRLDTAPPDRDPIRGTVS
jgi:hypothetical protein